MPRSLLALLGAALLAASCGSAQPSVVPGGQPSPSPSASAQPSPSATPTASPTPAATPAPTPPLSFAATVVSEGGGRIRSGPGMDQRIVGLEAQGVHELFDGWYRREGDIAQPDPATGSVEAWSRDWYRLADGRGWMHAITVDARRPAGMAQLTWEAPRPPHDPGTGRRIVISIEQQHLWALDGDQAIADTVIATGRPELSTVTGSFTILRKYSPYQFISPWPPGSPYWYAPAWTTYAMEFEQTGFFIHDAPWRVNWGPGANLIEGSHGCVNVPLGAMETLYAWAQVGDLVVVEA